VDRTTRELQRAGFAKANRNLAIQQAIARLDQELSGKSPEELVHFFAERRARVLIKLIDCSGAPWPTTIVIA
jgi:hypothetical protein